MVGNVGPSKIYVNILKEIKVFMMNIKVIIGFLSKIRVLQVFHHFFTKLYGFKGFARRPDSYIEPYEPCHKKTCFCNMRTTKAQISLRIRSV